MIFARVQIPTSFISEKTHEIVREAAADAPEILGIGLETLTGMALGGGGIAAALGAYKLAKRLLSRDRTPKGKGAVRSAEPFPRHLDEARQQRDLARYVERRIPEFDTAVGRVVQDELEMYRQRGTPEDRTILNTFWDGVRSRVDKLMPPSTREYLTNED